MACSLPIFGAEPENKATWPEYEAAWLGNEATWPEYEATWPGYEATWPGYGYLATCLGRQCKFAETWGYHSPWYRVCTNAIYIRKGSYGNGEPKNVNLILVQKAHFALRASKLPVFMHRGIGPSV